jgi:hypothetical protein
MAIAFSCSCGKAMKAKEAFAGRKVRCPQCDKVVRIPQRDHGEEGSAMPPGARPLSPLPFAEIRDGSRDHPALPAPKSAPRVVSTKEEDGDNGEQSLRPKAAEPAPRPSFAREKGSDRAPVAAATQISSLPRSAEPAEPRVAAPVHVWVDKSLSPQPTPWLPGDKERFQKEIKVMREEMSGLEKSVLGLVLLAGACTAGWFLFNK